MEQLRHDLNELFALQQSGVGSLAGARERLVADALTRPRRSRFGLSLAASLAAVLLVALAVGTLLLVHGRLTQHPAGRPTTAPTTAPTQAPPTPVPTPLAEPLQVPASTPVILYNDPVDPTQIDGVTWDGQSRGRVQAGGNPHPFAVPAGGPHAANQGPFSTQGFEARWADDRQHYCVMSHASLSPPAQGEPTTLKVGPALRTIVQVGTIHQQTSVRVAACSIVLDRAVIVQTAGQGVADAQYWVVQLSTGRILRTQSFQLDSVHSANVSASPDARYIAVVQSTCCRPTSTTPQTTIYSSSGTQLARVAGYLWDLSWDGSLAVMSRDNTVEVVRWRDGSVIWRGPAGGSYSMSFPEPSGQRIAVVVLHAGDPQHGDLWLVAPDGTAQRLITDPGA